MVFAADVYVTADDTTPSVTATLTDATGAAIDLTGATVTFRMAAPGSDTLKVNAAATVTNPTLGQVAYAWTAADTDTPGYYLARWRIVFSSGRIASVPNAGYLVVLVQEAV